MNKDTDIPIDIVNFIPKIVMQTWKTREVPDDWKISPKSVQDINPKWKYVLLTDEDNRNFIERHFPEYLLVFDLFPYGIQRADFIRYAWLYINGGIYLDLDYEVKVPFEFIIQSCGTDFDIAVPSLIKNVVNSFIISKPKCSFWLRLMDEIVKSELPWFAKLERHLFILYSTGPGIMNNLMEKFVNDYKFKYLPLFILNPSDDYETKTETLVKNLEGMSWVSPFGRFFVELYRWKVLIILIVLGVISIFLISKSFRTDL